MLFLQRILPVMMASPIPITVYAQVSAYEGGRGWGGLVATGVPLLIMLLIFATIFIAILALIRALTRWLNRHGKAAPPETALEILRKRYARGEIDKEEFEAKKHDLG